MPAPATAQAQPEQAQQPSQTTYEDKGPGYLVGNLTSDPELRFTPTGQALARLRVAETPRVQNPATGEWEDGTTSFYDVIVWGDQGQRAVERLLKGARIIAAGNWQEQTWQTPEGEQRRKLVLTAQDIGPSIKFLDVQVMHQPRKAGN